MNVMEQGGVNSSEYYKIFGKEQLSSAQTSDLGVTLGDITVAAIVSIRQSCKLLLAKNLTPWLTTRRQLLQLISLERKCPL